MKKKLLALLCVLALVLGLLAGCGADGASAEESVVAVSEAVEPEVQAETAEVPEEEPDPTADEPVSEESVEETVEEIPEEPAVVIEYPLVEEPVTVTYWCSYPGLYSSIAADWNTTICFPVMAEKIGINMSVTCVSFMGESEQYNLMIASGEWPDFIQTTYYPGGLIQAYNDDVILDLTDMLEENAPDYMRYVSQLDSDTLEVMDENGMNLAVYSLYDEVYTTRGMVARGDWLEELGLEVPTTLGAFTDMLYKMNSEYGSDYTYRVSEDGGITFLDDAFETEIVGIDGTEFPVYLDGDTIVSTYAADGYRDYLSWFAELYADGIFHQDFYSENSMDQAARYQNIVNGEIGVWEENAFSINDWQGYTSDPELLTAKAMGTIRGEDGIDNWTAIPVYAMEAGYSITTTCEDPALVLKFFNYFFTEEGMALANYGVEGETYTGIVDGKVQWTELIAANPDFSADNALNAYSLNKTLVPYYCDNDKLWNVYADNAVEAAQVWSDTSRCTWEHDIPAGASLTTEESNAISTMATDIMTYANEALMAFMTGAQPVNDETWAAFQDALAGFGMEEVVAAYQTAYDEYVAGER